MNALVLGGGAAKGLAHIGVIKALEELGFKPDLVVGCSMGSLVGSFYVAGMSPDEMLEIAKVVDRKKIAHFFTPHPSLAGFTDGKNVMKFLQEFYNGKRIEELKEKRFIAVATDLLTGEEIMIKEGPLYLAVRASIAIPGLFTPVYTKGRVLVDGGVVDPVPVRGARAMGYEKVIAVNVLTRERPELVEFGIEEGEGTEVNDSFLRFLHKNRINKPSLNLFNVALYSVYAMQGAIITNNLNLYRPDVFIEPDTTSIGLFDYDKGEHAFELGYNATMEKKQEILKLIEN